MIASEQDVPDLSGRVALVTGATGGIGIETARMLAGARAHVILAGRNAERGAEAIRTIAATAPKGTVEFESIDMADLASIAAGAARIAASFRELHILVNNAGVMMPPRRKTTADGFELQFGTNHLGHFALTGRLLPMLEAGRARVVTVSSNAARSGRMNFTDLNGERGYRAFPAYAQSKLANLLFTRQLQTLSDRNNWGLTSVAAHPGLSATNLVNNGIGAGLVGRLGNLFNIALAQSPAAGALPSVAAALELNLPRNAFLGPDGWGGWRGKPMLVALPPAAEDDNAAEQLWRLSENYANLRYGAGTL